MYRNSCFLGRAWYFFCMNEIDSAYRCHQITSPTNEALYFIIIMGSCKKSMVGKDEMKVKLNIYLKMNVYGFER